MLMIIGTLAPASASRTPAALRSPCSAYFSPPISLFRSRLAGQTGALAADLSEIVIAADALDEAQR